MVEELKHHELQQVYRWIDQIPLSRPKRNISRDFADGVLMSEVVSHFFPRLVDLHNYSMGNSAQQKNYNWDTLNMKVFKKMDYQVSKEMVKNIISHTRGAIERTLFEVQRVLADFQERGGDRGDAGDETPPAKGGGNQKTPQPKGGMLDPLKDKGKNRANEQKSPAPQKQPPQGSKQVLLPQSPAGDKKNPKIAIAAGVPPGKSDLQLQSVIQNKDGVITDLRETVDILTLKVGKLEQLVKLKNQKIASLARKLDQYNLGGISP